MASFGTEFVYSSTLRPPASGAYDSKSCAITRGAVPNDMVAFRSQHDSVGPGIHEQQFATTIYPATKVYLYAIERCGANGLWQDELFLGHHTPNGVANIMSEAREVNVRKSRLEWCPGMARQFHTKTGTTMPLVMGSDGLGFLKIRPITDRKRIVQLLRLSSLTPSWLLQQINAQNPAVL